MLNIPGLLVFPGWDDDRRDQFDALKGKLGRRGWVCHRANLPDASWAARQRESFTREDAFRQGLEDYGALRHIIGHDAVAVLGFSFGAYIGACIAASRHVRCLVLRSPALYPDEDWYIPKDELDQREMADYRRQLHGAAHNIALKACSYFQGNVLIIVSGEDQVIPKPVIESYKTSFVSAQSVTCHTIKHADHELSMPVWQREYHHIAVDWLDSCMART